MQHVYDKSFRMTRYSTQKQIERTLEVRQLRSLIRHTHILWHIYVVRQQTLKSQQHNARFKDTSNSISINGNSNRVADESTVSIKLLWLRHGNSSGTQGKGNENRWKPVPEDWRKDSGPRRLSACSGELKRVRNNKIEL
jgi:hypothetical protein